MINCKLDYQLIKTIALQNQCYPLDIIHLSLQRDIPLYFFLGPDGWLFNTPLDTVGITATIIKGEPEYCWFATLKSKESIRLTIRKETTGYEIVRKIDLEKLRIEEFIQTDLFGTELMDHEWALTYKRLIKREDLYIKTEHINHLSSPLKQRKISPTERKKQVEQFAFNTKKGMRREDIAIAFHAQNCHSSEPHDCKSTIATILRDVPTAASLKNRKDSEF